MKKYIVLALVLSLVFSPLLVNAQSADNVNIQAMIQKLMARLASLDYYRPTPRTNSGVQVDNQLCFPFTNFTFPDNLGVGGTSDTGKEIIELHRVLSKDSGIVIEGDTFNQATKAAVIKFQTKYQIPTTGYVGPLTRARLNKIYSLNECKITVKILSPNGGQFWVRGSKQAIEWQSELNQSRTVALRLVPVSSGLRCFTGPALIPTDCGFAGSSMVANTAEDLGRFEWTVGVGFPDIRDGQYKMSICTMSGFVCDQSDNFFSIVTQ